MEHLAIKIVKYVSAGTLASGVQRGSYGATAPGIQGRGIQRVKSHNFRFTITKLLWLHASSYCKASSTYWMDLMDIFLRGTCKSELNVSMIMWLRPSRFTKPEVAILTFSDSDSALVPKFLNPDPDLGSKFFQIWESDSCSNSDNYRNYRNSAMFLHKQ